MKRKIGDRHKGFLCTIFVPSYEFMIMWVKRFFKGSNWSRDKNSVSVTEHALGRTVD